MMVASNPPLPALDSRALVTIAQANCVRWGWDERFTKIIVGKLSRGAGAIAPLDPEAASTIIAMTRDGWGLVHALKHMRITQRRFCAWMLQAHSGHADDQPYRDFRQQLMAAFDDFTARTGVKDADKSRWLFGLDP